MPPRVGGAETGCDGAIGAGRGFGARFLAFDLLDGFPFIIPFFLRVGVPRFAFLDFFAMFNLPIQVKQNYATRYHTLAAELIPSPIDQNPCAHWRNPMDMIRQG